MAIYTKTGDQGKTSFGCGIVEKNDPRIEAFGALDELNSTIGVALCFIEDEKLREALIKIQNDLFQVGADLSETEEKIHLTTEHVQEIEEAIDRLEEKLGMPQKFILPGGTIASSFLHLCRANTRRAERALVRVKGEIHLNPLLLQYVNRLGDLLYVLARQANKELDVKEQQPIYKFFKEGLSKMGIK